MKYLVDLTDSLDDFRKLILKIPNIERINTKDFKCHNGIISVNNKALYPDNCLIFTPKYYSMARTYLDILKYKGYLVDTYADMSRLFSEDATIIGFLLNQKLLNLEVFYNTHNYKYSIDITKDIPIIKENTNGTIIVVPPKYPIQGFITFSYFCQIIGTIYVVLDIEKTIFYYPEEKTVYKFNKEGDKPERETFVEEEFVRQFKQLEEARYLTEETAISLSSELKIAPLEIYSLIDNDNLEIYKLQVTREPLIKDMMDSNKFGTKILDVFNILINEASSWEDLEEIGYEEIS
ncbi:MAG: hypothetical protein QXK24_00030 [Ignisphaera sp.]